MTDVAHMTIQWVRVQGYRSLEDVTVELEPVTVLVGPNGVGKTSFVDALAFLQQSLAESPRDAVGSRGGVRALRPKTGSRATEFRIVIHLQSRSPDQFQSQYAIRLKWTRSEVEVYHELCTVHAGPQMESHEYEVRQGRWVHGPAGIQPPLAADRLALPLLAGLEYFAPIHRALTSMFFYRIQPDKVSGSYRRTGEDRLLQDGRNAAEVLRRLRDEDKGIYDRVLQALQRVVPDVDAIELKWTSDRWRMNFEQTATGNGPVSFEASSMSAGTLRVLGTLLAVYQPNPPTLVALEEPETDLHPGAVAVLGDALQEAALRTQVVITTHSPDLITRFPVAQLRAVGRNNGITVIAPVREPQRQAITQGLFSAGEIHRIEGLSPGQPALPSEDMHA